MWLARSAVLADALHQALEASVDAAVDYDKGTRRLQTCGARVDGIASALEQDLIACSSSGNAAAAQPPPSQLISELAAREEEAARRTKL